MEAKEGRERDAGGGERGNEGERLAPPSPPAMLHGDAPSLSAWSSSSYLLRHTPTDTQRGGERERESDGEREL